MELGAKKASNPLGLFYDIGLEVLLKDGETSVYDLMRIMVDRLQTAARTCSELFRLPVALSSDGLWMKEVLAVVKDERMVCVLEDVSGGSYGDEGSGFEDDEFFEEGESQGVDVDSGSERSEG